MKGEEMKRLILGALLLLGAFWGGSYAVHLFHDSWCLFPVLMSAFMVGICGIAGIADGITEKWG
jgi:hypothetical protein